MADLTLVRPGVTQVLNKSIPMGATTVYTHDLGVVPNMVSIQARESVALDNVFKAGATDTNISVTNHDGGNAYLCDITAFAL